MARKYFNVSWVGVYRASSNSYYGSNTPIRVGGSYGYNSYIGIPSSVKDAIKTSKTPAKLYFRMNVTDAGEFDFGAHKETYNKGTGTMPWYTYIGLAPNYSTGWRETDLTSSFMSNYVKGTYHGIVVYGAVGGSYGIAYGKTGNSNQAQFVVEGEWNTAPTPPPSFNSPRSSTVADSSVMVDWQAGSDNESSASELSYELRYYDGSKWYATISVGAGTTSYNYTLLDNKPESSRARFSVRTVDPQGLKSDWAYSPYFTVDHNQPPSKPTNLTPTGGKRIDRESNLRVTWKHNDDGVQAGYRIAWRLLGADGTPSSWNYIPSSTGWVNSTSEYHDFAGNTFPLGEIEWFVRTKDQQGEESPASSYERFYAGETSDAPIWLHPTSGATLNASELIADWSSVDQIEYELELLDNSGAVLWSENEIASNKSTRVGYALENETTYSLRIRVVNENSQLWSEWSEITFSTQFIPPAKPIIDVETVDEGGTSRDTIVISWETDNPESETPTDFVQVYRREYNSSVEQPWRLIGNNQAPNSSMVDYTPASDQAYEYKVRAWGDNDTHTDSDIVEAEIVLTHSFLHVASQPSNLLVLDIEERSQEFDWGGEMMVFANREKPVFEYGINELMTLPIKFSIDSPAELRSVLQLIKRRETFLYRDTSGRRFFCVVRQPAVTDKPVSGFEIELTLHEVDSDEIIQGG